ncbi:PHP domain-containing protein [candidate division KSB1 bacterium]|nr:PHP domain-containing protein [candidate division KSB1 bacterium]
MLRWYRGDLHVHTVLSPCGALLMGPKNIVPRALAIGLNLLAITDHNASENVPGVLKAAENTNLMVVPGMEVTSQEEGHLICLFASMQLLDEFQALIYEHLTPGENAPDFFGPQYIVNENNEVLGENKRLLIFATTLKTRQIIDAVTEKGGICYPAHIERKAYSLLNQLGFIPDDLTFPALEISWNASVSKVIKQFPQAVNYPLIRSSDAHHTDEMGRGSTWFLMEKLSFEELVLAIQHRENRRIYIEKEIL